MHYFSNLQQNKLYDRFPISGKTHTGNKKEGTAILVLSEDEQDFKDILNNRIFSPMNFKGVYIPRKITSPVNKKAITINQKEYYDSFKTVCPNITIYKNFLDAYKGKNVFYNMNIELNQFNGTVRSVGDKRISQFKILLDEKIKELSKNYTNVIILTPISNMEGDITSYLNNKNKAEHTIQYMYHLIKENKLDYPNVDLLFIASNVRKYFYKDCRDNDAVLNKQTPLSLIKLIKKSSNVIEPGEDEVNSSVDDSEVRSLKMLNTLLKQVGLSYNKLPSNVMSQMETMQTIAQDMISSSSDITDEEIIDELNKVPEFIEAFMELVEIQKVGKQNSDNEKKITKLLDKQSNISVDGNINIKDIISGFKDKAIEKSVMEVDTINENIKSSSLNDFDNSYQDKQLEKDIISIFSGFNNDTDVKVFITDIKTEDSSDDLSKKKTYTVKLEDENGIKHTVVVDLPVIREGKFMYLNGGKKLIQKQITLLPIIKTHPDNVQVTSNYNKLFVSRFGQKTSTRTENLKKILKMDLSSYMLSDRKFEVSKGNAKNINAKLETTLEYLDLSSSVVNIKANGIELIFNYTIIKEMLDPNKKTYNEEFASIMSSYEENYMMIGHISTGEKRVILTDKNTGEIFIATSKEIIKEADSLFDFIIAIVRECTDSTIERELNKKPSNSLTYSRVSINNKKIPLIVVMGYELGLTNVLSRYNINYEFTQDKVKYEIDSKKDRIDFADGTLIYDSSKLRNSLLLSGLNAVDCSFYNFEDMDSLEPYLEIFYKLTASRNAGKGIHNNLSLMIDPITLDVLKDLKLPENIYDILLYANTLLEDVSYKRMNDMSTYRIRGAEQVPAMLYNCLANYVREYKDKSRNGSQGARISMPRDIVIKKLVEGATVDEYSVLNPSLEIEKAGSATYKGNGGINLDSAFTTDIRAYHPSMAGLFSYSTPDSGKVGVVRQLTYNPRLLNTRGFVETEGNNIDPSVDLFAPAELMNSFTSTHADPPRNFAIHSGNIMSKLL